MDTISDNNRTSSIVLIISFAVFVLSIFLMEWDALTAAYYGIHEVISLVYGLSILVLPVEGILWFVFWRRYIKIRCHSSIFRFQRKNTMKLKTELYKDMHIPLNT